MPRGDKSSYTDTQKRMAEHIEEGYEQRGMRQVSTHAAHFWAASGLILRIAGRDPRSGAHSTRCLARLASSFGVLMIFSTIFCMSSP